MTANCDTCANYRKHLRNCKREKRGEPCEWERRPNWELFTHRPMTSEEKREVLTKMLGRDPGPQYGDNKEATAV